MLNLDYLRLLKQRSAKHWHISLGMDIPICDLNFSVLALKVTDLRSFEHVLWIAEKCVRRTTLGKTLFWSILVQIVAC